MEFDSAKVNWHFNALPTPTKKALDFFAKQEWLKKSGWYLAGGTALALLAGNRKSLDLDFFLPKKDFDTNKLLLKLFNVKNWKLSIQEKNTIHGSLYNVKVSFMVNPFFVPKKKFIKYENVNVLSPLDVAVTKVVTISQRGMKKDFYDLYWCANNLEPLEKIIQKVKRQYPKTIKDYHHILKALVYFDDAENDPDPTIYFDTSWKQVKKFFIQEVPLVAKKLMKLK